MCEQCRSLRTWIQRHFAFHFASFACFQARAFRQLHLVRGCGEPTVCIKYRRVFFLPSNTGSETQVLLGLANTNRQLSAQIILDEAVSYRFSWRTRCKRAGREIADMPSGPRAQPKGIAACRPRSLTRFSSTMRAARFAKPLLANRIRKSSSTKRADHPAGDRAVSSRAACV